MLLKVFQLKPGVGSDFRGYSDQLAHLGNNYMFIVGTKNPTNRDRERIRKAIAGAWEGIFDDSQGDLIRFFGRKIFPPAYGVTVVPDLSSPTGETSLPPFVYNGFYMVFALLESESGLTLSEDEERQISQDIGEALKDQVRDMAHKPRIGVVTLFNCSVHMLEGEDYQ